jgi:hypothetical protein
MAIRRLEGSSVCASSFLRSSISRSWCLLRSGAVWEGRPLRSDPAEDPALGERTRIGHDEPCQEPVGRGIDPAVVPLVNQPFRERPSGSHIERGVLRRAQSEDRTEDRTVSLVSHVSPVLPGSTTRFVAGQRAVSGPGRDRTCDLGIKSPAGTVATTCEPSKLAATTADHACHGDVPRTSSRSTSSNPYEPDAYLLPSRARSKKAMTRRSYSRG